MKKHRNQMDLGELIAALERKDPEANVYFDFAHFRPTGDIYSYRGYYEDLALEYGNEKEALTVAELIEAIKPMTNSSVTGYKGGEYDVDESTPVWVALHNEAGNTAVVDVIGDHSVYILTRYVEA